jgi:hypothetical protein
MAQKQPVDGVQNPEKSGKVGEQLVVAGRSRRACRLRANPLEDLAERALAVDVPEHVFRERPGSTRVVMPLKLWFSRTGGRDGG